MIGRSLRLVTWRPSYYVDTAGNDSNNGLSTATAWATLAKVTSSAPAGSRVFLKKGCAWLEELIINRDRISVGTYGAGAKPIINRGTEPTGGVFDDGFESETSSFNTNWEGITNSGTSTLDIESSNPITGSKSMRYVHASSSSKYASKTFTGMSDIYVQMKVRIDTLVTGSAFANLNLLALVGPAATQFLFLRHDATPANGVQFGMQGTSGTVILETGYHQAGAQVRVEIRYLVGAGTGGFQIWIDGVSLGSNYAKTNANNVTGIRVGCTGFNATGLGAGTTVVMDDVKVSSTAIGLGPRASWGVTVDTVTDVTIDGLEVKNVDQYGIRLRNAVSATVRNCYIHDINQVGLYAYSPGAVTNGGHLIEDNELTKSGQSAASGAGGLMQVANTVTLPNIIRRNYYHDLTATSLDHGLYNEGGAGSTITANRFVTISGAGVKSRVAALITRNRMITCKTAAFYSDQGTNILVYNNSAYNCGQFPSGNSPYVGYWFQTPGTGCELKNNISTGSGIGLQVTGANTPTIDYNDITATVRYGHWKGTDCASLAAWRTASSQSAHDINSDPLYTSPASNDLTLQGASPSINAGVAIAGVTDGFLGSAPDQGYLETA